MIKDLISKLFRYSNNNSIIILCFIISLFFWVIIKLSKNYNEKIYLNVNYKNYPIDMFLQNEPDHIIEINALGYGVDFFKEMFFNRSVDIDVSNLKNDKNEFVFITKNEKLKVSNLFKNFKIIDFKPDTLWLNFSLKRKKKIPIRINKKITYAKNFDKYGSFKFSPESMNIFGPSFILDTIDSLDTEWINLKNVNKNIERDVKILLNHDLIVSEFNHIKIQQNVARYTQVNINLPIKVLNKPKNTELILNPNNVKLSYWIALDDFEKVNESDFLIYCDYSEFEISNSDKINIFFDEETKSTLISNVKFYPSNVEYINIRYD
ncbi:MAG: hypothetical protein CMD07_03485 [Flavobacteriales bacterium]|nr:hypothetical protein [Flavobacteriales bacterium]|tara:strand:+ start:61 stop:1023 length:963 start_codon:yes stop_codon:yes gene_type:complete